MTTTLCENCRAAEPEALPFAALGYALTGITATLLCSLPPVRAALLFVTG